MRKNIQKGKAFSKLVAAALAAACVFMSAPEASAAEVSAETGSSSVTDLQEIIGEETTIGTPVEMEDGTVMYKCKIEDLDTGRTRTVYDLMQGGTSAQAVDTIYRIDWTVKPDTRHVSSEHTLTKGQLLGAGVSVSPDSKTYKFGFMDDEGTAWYVNGRGASSFNYKIPRKEQYRVFVQNDYKSTYFYTVGSYAYHNLK